MGMTPTFAPGASEKLAAVSAILNGINRGKAIRQMQAGQQLSKQYEMAVMQYQMISQQWQSAAQNLQSAMASGNQTAIKAAQQIFSDLESQRMEAENQVKQVAQEITEYDGPGVPQAPKKRKEASKQEGVADTFKHAARGAYNALTSILQPSPSPMQVFKPVGINPQGNTQPQAPAMGQAAPKTAANSLSPAALNPYPTIAPAAPSGPQTLQPGTFSVVR